MLDDIIKLKIQLRDLALQHYKQYELFDWHWWLNLALVIIPMIIWWIALDKKRLLEICVFGLLVNLVATFLDVAGTHYVFWEYPYYTFPHLPLFIPVDYVIVPVVGMTIYQRFSKWKSFIIVSLVLSAFMSFVCEPLAVYINLYKLITWRYIYSLPIYFIIYIGSKLVTEKFVHINDIEVTISETSDEGYPG